MPLPPSSSPYHLPQTSETCLRWRRFFLVLLVVAVPVVASSQGRRDQGATDKTAQAEAYARAAVRLMDNNMADSAGVLLAKAIELLPDNIVYRYEHALTHVMAQRYDTALALLTPIYDDTLLADRGYQLMGNIYDMKNDSSKSLPYYRAGVARYPWSGRLHYELGAAAYLDDEVDSAIVWWRRGTKAQPNYPTNYYWLAKVFSVREDRLWAAFYGEVYVNLDRGSERTKEISKLVYATWNGCLAFGDTIDPINFCSDELLERSRPANPDVMNFPMAFEYSIATNGQHLIPDKGIKAKCSIAELADLRQRFLRSWKKAGYDTLYHNDVIAWNLKMAEAGWLTEYLYWLYSYGNIQEMRDYFRQHEQRYDTFLAWFGDRSIPVDRPLCLEDDCR